MGLLPPWHKESRNGHTYKVPTNLNTTTTLPQAKDLWVIVEEGTTTTPLNVFGPLTSLNRARTIATLWALRSEGTRRFRVKELYDTSTPNGLGD